MIVSGLGVNGLITSVNDGSFDVGSIGGGFRPSLQVVDIKKIFDEHSELQAEFDVFVGRGTFVNIGAFFML